MPCSRKFNDPKVIVPRDAFIAAAIEQSHEVHTVRRRFGIGGRIGESQLDPTRRLALHEHIVQYALCVDSLGVKHRIAALNDLNRPASSWPNCASLIAD